MFAGEIQCLWKLVRLPSEVIPFVILDYIAYNPNKVAVDCHDDVESTIWRLPAFKGCQNQSVVLLLYLITWFIPAFFETIELFYLVKFPLRETRYTTLNENLLLT